MSASPTKPSVAAPPQHHPKPHHSRLALADAKGQLGRRALKLVGYLAVAYLIVRLIPSLRQALRDLEHVRWEWVVAALALELVSEIGFVASWRAIVDPEDVLARDGRGERTATRAAWAQLGGGMLVPGGSLSGVGVGAWILHRFGMSTKLVAERQFNLSFLNTALDALALIIFGVGLATGIFAGESRLLLTLLPAALALLGVLAALGTSRRASSFAPRLGPKHPKLSGLITTLADAVRATERLLVHRGGSRSELGAVVYLGFDVLVLYSSFIALHA